MGFPTVGGFLGLALGIPDDRNVGIPRKNTGNQAFVMKEHTILTYNRLQCILHYKLSRQSCMYASSKQNLNVAREIMKR